MTGLTGTAALVRLALRRDRVMLPAWLFALVLTLYGSVVSTAAVYPTADARREAAQAIGSSPAVIALYGPATDLGTLGGLATWKPNTFLAVLVALMSMLLVVRHTRADEETGRLELLGSTVVGRHASLTAALIVAAGTNVALAALMTLSVLGQDLPTAGVAALSLGFCGVGLVFAAVAAVAAQLTESSRTANGITATVLGVAFLLRAVGDTGPSWPSWLSPIGWAQRLRPFGDLNWWPLVLPALAVPLLVAVAYRLSGRRDLAAGFLAPRPGPADGALHGPFALAWRLQRGALLGWAVGFALAGAAIGSIASGAGDLLGDNQWVRDFITRFGGEQAIVDSYLATSMGIIGIVATAYAVQAALRLRGEEVAQRVEPLLAGGVGRVRWVLSHLAVAVLGPAVLLTVAGLAAGVAHGIRVGEVGQVPRVLGGALVQLPAVWVVVGITLALFGLVPRVATAGWGVLVLFLLLTELGPSLRLSRWVLDASPFAHVPKLPVMPFTAAPLVALLAVALAFAAVGLVGVRRRDLG